MMFRMLISISVLLCVFSLPGAIHLVSGSSGDSTSHSGGGIPIESKNYGLIITDHRNILPSITNDGSTAHYVIANLPSEQAGGLTSFACLFTRHDDAPADVENSIWLHIAKPTGTNSIQYETSVEMRGIQSGEKWIFPNAIPIEVGDMISLSVPGNMLSLRAGLNRQGSPISYGFFSVPSTTSSTSTIVSSYSLLSTPSDTDPIQLCAAFTTYGSAGSTYSGNYYASHNANYWFDFQNPITTPGDVISMRANFYPESAGKKGVITMLIARKDSFGVYRVLPGGPYTVNAGQEVLEDQTVPTQRIPVQSGDILGYKSTYACFVAAPLLPGQSSFLMAQLSVGGTPNANFANTIISKSTYGLRLSVEATVENGFRGDPQFVGFQGQSYQVHGIPDEYFALVSTPRFYINSHFTYIATGTCDYNETECFSHAGTYIDEVGFGLRGINVTAKAGSHSRGMTLFINEQQVTVPHGQSSARYVLSSTMTGTNEDCALIQYGNNKVTFDCEMLGMSLTNSDLFFNSAVHLKDRALLAAGAKKTKRSHGHGHSLHQHSKEDSIYPSYPLHGLIGQTWKNIVYTDAHVIEGTHNDYITGELFNPQFHFSQYKQ